MNKIFTCVVIALLFCLGTTSKTFGQSPTLLMNLYDTCTNDTLHHTMIVNYTNTPLMYKLILRTSNGSLIEEDTVTFSNNILYRNIRGKVGITSYKAIVYDDVANVLVDSVEVLTSFASVNCRLFSVTPYVDIDSNCTASFGDKYTYPRINVYNNNILERSVINTISESVPQSLYFSSFYTAATDSISIVPQTSNTNCYSSSSLSFRMDTLTINNLDYAIKCETGEDFNITVGGNYRTVAAPSYIYIFYANHSCITRSTTLTYTFPPSYIFGNSNNSNYTLSGNTLTYTLSNIPSSGNNYIAITLLNTDSTMILGDSVQHFINIGNLAVDQSPANNVDTGYYKILASYAPNHKTASPEKYLSAATQTIEYLVEFENLGNDTAFHVRITDTLSDLLDMSTFKILSSSHNYNYSLENKFLRNVLTFDFPEIKLADSSKPESNKGWIKYAIQPRSSLVIGDTIKNTAYIYFDNNDAIITNTTNNLLRPLSIQPTKWSSTIHIYPNPMNNYLTIEDKSTSVHTVTVRNIVGQIVYSQQVGNNNGLLHIETSNWQAGLYLVSCSNKEGRTQTYKVVKQ